MDSFELIVKLRVDLLKDDREKMRTMVHVDNDLKQQTTFAYKFIHYENKSLLIRNEIYQSNRG